VHQYTLIGIKKNYNVMATIAVVKKKFKTKLVVEDTFSCKQLKSPSFELEELRHLNPKGERADG